MGNIINLDADTRATMQGAFDDLIGIAGKPCLIVYPPRWNLCGNCIFDPMKQLSSNRWKTGGPMPFPAGAPCPLCSGKGRRADEVSETITMICTWVPKPWYNKGPQVDELRIPYGLLQTKGFLTDLPRIQKCDHLQVELPIQGVLVANYKLVAQPGDLHHFIQGRYCVAKWEMMG